MKSPENWENQAFAIVACAKRPLEVLPLLSLQCQFKILSGREALRRNFDLPQSSLEAFAETAELQCFCLKKESLISR